MAQPFLGQIAVFGFGFAPINWMTCQGQILPISQYAALFSLLGTNFGGNGTSTFQLPNFAGSVALGQGTATGGSTYDIGEQGGMSQVTVTTASDASHTHALMGTTTEATLNTAQGNVLSRPGKGAGREQVPGFMYTATAPDVTLQAKSIVPFTGGNVPHNNMQPFLALNYCICVKGIFPNRN
jgi:microcystin-dependent protein